MEAFYAKAKQADVLIYSSTIDGELQTMEELLEKSPVLSDCKAVKEGAVWCTGKNLFQESLGLGDLMVDIHKILTEDQVAQDELTYLHPFAVMGEDGTHEAGDETIWGCVCSAAGAVGRASDLEPERRQFSHDASQVLAILFGQGGEETASRIVWDIRLPRILGAALLGGALSISGFLLQTFFANPIASPFVLGISSGAKLTVALTMIFLLQQGDSIQFLCADWVSLCGGHAVHGVCAVGFPKDPADVCAGDLRNYGGLHLLRRDRFRGDLCRRRQHRQPAQLVGGQFFWNHVEQFGGHCGDGGPGGPLGLLSVQANGRVSAGESYAQSVGFPSAGFAWS